MPYKNLSFLYTFTLVCLSAIAAGIRGGFFKVAMVRLNIRIRNHLFSSMLSQEIGFFDSIRTGESHVIGESHVSHMSLVSHM